MRRFESMLWAILLGAGLTLAGLGFLRMSSSSPNGPVEPSWDHQTCAQCGMLLSDPRFACEIRRASGETLFFDDPGCLLSYLKAHPRPPSQVVYLHRHNGAGWLPIEGAAFVEVPDSPMGYRLACVDPSQAGSHTLAWAGDRADAEPQGRDDRTTDSPEGKKHD
jgi:copper chaperone NosL